MKVDELKLLAETRLKESKLLFENSALEGACYLSFYAIELGLKASCCKSLDLEDYPDRLQSFKTHRLKDLLLLSGLTKLFEMECQSDFMLDSSWKSISSHEKWNEDFRYNSIGSKKEEYLLIIFAEIDYLFNWIKRKW